MAILKSKMADIWLLSVMAEKYMLLETYIIVLWQYVAEIWAKLCFNRAHFDILDDILGCHGNRGFFFYLFCSWLPWPNPPLCQICSIFWNSRWPPVAMVMEDFFVLSVFDSHGLIYLCAKFAWYANLNSTLTAPLISLSRSWIRGRKSYALSGCTKYTTHTIKLVYDFFRWW